MEKVVHIAAMPTKFWIAYKTIYLKNSQKIYVENRLINKNNLNQSENVGISNIFISFLFDTFMRIDWINPTNKLTASTHTSSYNSMVAFL